MHLTLQNRFLIGFGAFLIAIGLFLVRGDLHHSTHAQTPPNVCAAGQFVNSQLANTGQVCGPVTTAATAAPGTNDTTVATTAFVGNAVTTATSGAVKYFGSSGALTGVKCYIGSATTSSSGVWSFTISGAGITTLRSVQVNALSPTGSSATQQYVSYLNTASTTTISGVTYSGAVLSLLGATLIPITAATTVYVEACGT